MIVFNYFMETAARPQELLGRWSTILIKTILVLIKYIILIYFIRKGHCFSQIRSKKVFGKENKSEPRKFGIEFIEFMVSGIELIEFMVSTKTSAILVITLVK